MKKALLVILVSLTVIIGFTVSAGAATIESEAQNIAANSTYSITLEKGVRQSYKITVPQGKATLSVSADVSDYAFSLLDSDMGRVPQTDYKLTSGTIYRNGYIYFNGSQITDVYYGEWDKGREKSVGSIDFSLKSGTYYIVFWRSDNATGYDTLKFSLKTAAVKSETTLTTAGVKLAVKDSVSLYSDQMAAYKSSNSKVIKVDGNGKVTAVSKGKASVAITVGKSVTTVYFKVS